jgi:hypothetical protein
METAFEILSWVALVAGVLGVAITVAEFRVERRQVAAKWQAVKELQVPVLEDSRLVAVLLSIENPTIRKLSSDPALYSRVESFLVEMDERGRPDDPEVNS